MKLSEANILFVEDEAIARMLVQKMLSPIVNNVYLAKNGQEGWESYKKDCPDLIITDLNMPIMDGAEFIQLVRNDCSHIPVVIVSAYVSDYPSVIGANAILNKPLNKHKLISTLELQLSKFDNQYGLTHEPSLN